MKIKIISDTELSKSTLSFLNDCANTHFGHFIMESNGCEVKMEINDYIFIKDLVKAKVNKETREYEATLVTSEEKTDVYNPFETDILNKLNLKMEVIEDYYDLYKAFTENKEYSFSVVSESNPYYSSDSYTVFENDYDANAYFEECCERQGGRASFDDDNGGMDYNIETYDSIAFFDIIVYYGLDNAINFIQALSDD